MFPVPRFSISNLTALKRRQEESQLFDGAKNVRQQIYDTKPSCAHGAKVCFGVVDKPLYCGEVCDEDVFSTWNSVDELQDEEKHVFHNTNLRNCAHQLDPNKRSAFSYSVPRTDASVPCSVHVLLSR